MIKLILFLTTLVIITSCVTGYQEKDIRIYYQDGTTEDLTISAEKGYTNQLGDKEAEIYFHNGCLYMYHQETKYDANFTGCIRCGVKSCVILRVRNIKID
jgi:hypothetical protein